MVMLTNIEEYPSILRKTRLLTTLITRYDTSMMSAIILIGICALICLIASPFLLVLWLVHKWAKWCSNMVNGDAKKDESKEVLKMLAKLLSK